MSETHLRKIDIAGQKTPPSRDPGPAPMLQWVKIDDLVIDDGYQRDLRASSWKAIRAIAASFKWSRFSPVFVAPVEGGFYAIIDGQHRAHAAKLCGFKEVPCQIVQMTKEEQASSFTAVNNLVTRVTSWGVYKAGLAAGEGWAVECERAVKNAGCTLMTSTISKDKRPGDIFAVVLVRKFVDAGHSGAVTLALSGIKRSEFGKDMEAYGNVMLKPIFMAVAERPWLAAADVDLAEFFDQLDIYTVMDKAAEFVKIKKRQGHFGTSKFDIAAADIGEALDKRYPQRMAAA